MNVVIETALEVEAGRLPEFAAHLTSVIPVEEELREIADGKETGTIGLTSSVEAASKVTVILHISLEVPHLGETVD